MELYPSSGVQFSVAHATQGFIYLGEAALCPWAAWPERVRRDGARGGMGPVIRVAQRSENGSADRVLPARAALPARCRPSAGGEPSA